MCIRDSLQDYTIIANEDELSTLAPYKKIGIVSQTTQQIQHVKNLIAKIREVYPEMEVRFQDTVCQPTKDRQVAARELTSEVDLMIVIGGYNSSNTRSSRWSVTNLVSRPSTSRVPAN